MNNEENQIYQLNKIIREKNEEIDSKDKLISSLKIQINSIQNFKSQNDSFKKQTLSLEEKLNNSEMENNSFISEKLRELSDSENRLRANLIQKDKILYDYNNTIKDHENTICMIKRQLIEKESSLNNLKHENTELLNKWKSMTFLFNQKDEEFVNFKANSQKELLDFSREKENLETRLSEYKLNNLNLSKSNNELDYKIRVLEKDLSTERNTNFSSRSIIEELSSLVTKNKEELSELRDIKKVFIENEKYLDKLKAELETEQTKNKQLNEQLVETNNNYKELKVKYSGENTIENLQSSRELMQNENNNLKNTVDTLNQLNQSYSVSLNSLKKELAEILDNVSTEIKNICQWVEIYLGSHFEDEMEIATLPITINKTLKDCSKLDELKQILFTTRRKTNEEFVKLDKSNKLLKYEIEENLKNQEKLMKEIIELKSFNINDEERKDLNNKINRYEAIITKIQNFYHQMNKTDKNVNNEKSSIDELENDVFKLLGILETNMNKDGSIDNQKLRFDYEKLKEDILLEKNGKDSLTFKKKEEEIDNLKMDIENLKKELANKDYIIKISKGLDKGDILNETAMLEKRITNLLREIELKDIQITSQEQMINRRNRELEEHRNKSVFNTQTDKSFISTQKYKNFEVEKENLNLIKENRDLKEHINKLINELPDENNDNYLKELQQNLNLCEEEIKNKDILIRQLLAENRYLKQVHSSYRVEETEKTDKSEVKEFSQEVKGLRSKIKKQNK